MHLDHVPDYGGTDGVNEVRSEGSSDGKILYRDHRRELGAAAGHRDTGDLLLAPGGSEVSPPDRAGRVNPARRAESPDPMKWCMSYQLPAHFETAGTNIGQFS
jgi:hypothetical protein